MVKTVTLPIRIEPSCGQTLQDQIYFCIRRSIVDGVIRTDGRLPSTRALAADLGVSRTTVLLAFEQLKAEGYIVPRQGSGIYIAKVLPDRRPDRPVVRAVAAVKHPLFSARGRSLAQARFADRRAPMPPRPFRLGTPAVDLFPVRLWSQIARQCVRSLSPTRLDYSSLPGLLRLREAIAEQLRSRGTSCDPQQVLVVAGAQRGIDLVFHLLLDVGDPVWIEDPGYPGAHSALLSAGARAVCMPVDQEGMIIDRQRPGQIEARLAYVTPSHQFPLGVPMSLARRHSLLAWASNSLAWILEDDYDCNFRYDAQPLPCLHALDPDGRVIYVGTFSKTLFPALRLGFLIVPNDLVDGFVRARMASDVHPPVLEQMILSEFITRGHYQRHVRRMQAEYAERLYTLRTAVDRTGAALRLRPVHSGIHAVADLEDIDAERVVAEATASNIEVMPLSAYYYGGGERSNALLLGFGACPPVAIRAGMWRLAAAIDAARRPQ
ncbi:MAG: transcriptional regulator, GntR family [Gammaproteobacteria bacterium]|jgi:GntR family transcriptional regulator/MocR family aminotransferase|nr:transcriptional regulator, GntR family [Gammaproteobacteria bacterium]